MKEENNSKKDNERTWVKELCEEIKKHADWDKEYSIEYEVALPHSISLNNYLKFEETKKDGTIKKKLGIDKDVFKEKYKEETDVEYWNVDIVVFETATNKPRVVIEAKYKDINTHDPITYSHKAVLHKMLFCGLRYGLIVGNYCKDSQRKVENFYIPNRVVEYGDNFDFVILFKEKLNHQEITNFIKVINENIKISKDIEDFYNTKPKVKYTCVKKNIEFE